MLEVKKLFLKINNNVILDNINFEIGENNYLSIIGANGSGKSTLLKVILGLIEPNSGEVNIKNISKMQIGYVPQIKTLDRSFPASVYELVASGLKTKWPIFISSSEKKKIYQALEFTGATHLYNKAVSGLSGGELQRVYLARSIIREPKLLLLDEPATGIDLVCEKDISGNILNYKNEKKALVIIVTHDLTSAFEHTNYSLMLNKHQVFFGSSKDAFTDTNLQATFSHFGHAHKYKLEMVKNA